MYRNLIEHILITDKIQLESFFITNTVSKRSMMQFARFIDGLANLKNSSPSTNDDRNENKNYIFIFLTTGKRGTEEEISQSRREGGRGQIGTCLALRVHTDDEGLSSLWLAGTETTLESAVRYEDEISYRARRVDVLARRRTRRIT